jgi:hypothetical protein
VDSWKTFTRMLYEEYDADPGYYAIMFSDLPLDQKKRIIVGWCAYYNLGLAARASAYTGKKFYATLWAMYDEQPPVKRGSERRHFRGEAGAQALRQWQELFPQPEGMVDYMFTPLRRKLTYFDIRERADQLRMMGPYFFWKWADLHEVVTGSPVDFSFAEKFSPPVPQEGAAMLFPGKAVDRAYGAIVEWARGKGIVTPTGPTRPFDVQEAETVCCVYHQYASGRYEYGMRTGKAIGRLAENPCGASEAMIEALLEVSPYTREQLHTIVAGSKGGGH